jgi:hypothetical protein
MPKFCSELGRAAKRFVAHRVNNWYLRWKIALEKIRTGSTTGDTLKGLALFKGVKR